MQRNKVLYLSTFTTCLFYILFIPVHFSFAENSSSENYSIEAGTFSGGGTFQGASETYIMEGSSGEALVGSGNSGQYVNEGGFVSQSSNFNQNQSGSSSNVATSSNSSTNQGSNTGSRGFIAYPSISNYSTINTQIEESYNDKRYSTTSAYVAKVNDKLNIKEIISDTNSQVVKYIKSLPLYVRISFYICMFLILILLVRLSRYFL